MAAMATQLLTNTLSSPSCTLKNTRTPNSSPFIKHPSSQRRCFSFSVKPLKFSVKDDPERESSSFSSSIAIVSDKPSNENDTQISVELSSEELELSKGDGGVDDGGTDEREKQQELDWKTDEEFKKFMGNI